MVYLLICFLMGIKAGSRPWPWWTVQRYPCTCMDLCSPLMVSSLGIHLLRGKVGSMIILVLFFFFKKPPPWFTQWLDQFTLPQAQNKSASFAICSVTFIYVAFLVVDILTWGGGGDGLSRQFWSVFPWCLRIWNTFPNITQHLYFSFENCLFFAQAYILIGGFNMRVIFNIGLIPHQSDAWQRFSPFCAVSLCSAWAWLCWAETSLFYVLLFVNPGDCFLRY